MRIALIIAASAALAASSAAANSGAVAVPVTDNAAATDNVSVLADDNLAAPLPPDANMVAEPAPVTETAAADTADDDRGFPWGVLGLVGLVGLLGRRRS